MDCDKTSLYCSVRTLFPIHLFCARYTAGPCQASTEHGNDITMKWAGQPILKTALSYIYWTLVKSPLTTYGLRHKYLRPPFGSPSASILRISAAHSGQSSVRQRSLVFLIGVQIPIEQGLTSHSYRVLQSSRR